MTKIRLTRETNALGERVYRFESNTHRYVTSRLDDRGVWWVTKIYTLKRVGVMNPPLMIGDRYVGSLCNLTLADAREEISQDVEKRRAAQ